MKTFYENARYAVVDDYAPGLKIYDKILQRVNLTRFGAFYDNVPGYPTSALEAATAAADRAAAEDDKKHAEYVAARNKRLSDS